MVVNMVKEFSKKEIKDLDEGKQNLRDSVDDYDTIDDDDDRQDFMRGYEEGMFGDDDAYEDDDLR